MRDYNPEADEISPEDLEAAAEMYERIRREFLLDSIQLLDFDPRVGSYKICTLTMAL